MKLIFSCGCYIWLHSGTSADKLALCKKHQESAILQNEGWIDGYDVYHGLDIIKRRETQ